jgi:hypothetical protein
MSETPRHTLQPGSQHTETTEHVDVTVDSIIGSMLANNLAKALDEPPRVTGAGARNLADPQFPRTPGKKAVHGVQCCDIHLDSEFGALLTEINQPALNPSGAEHGC